MKKLIVLIAVFSACLFGQGNLSVPATQVCSYPGEDENNAGGKSTCRVGNGNSYYHMLVRINLSGQSVNLPCSLLLYQTPASSGGTTRDYADGEFSNTVSTVAGDWENGTANESEQEGSVCFKYRAYSATSPTLWEEGNSSSNLNTVSNGASDTRMNSTDIVLNTSASGLPSVLILDEEIVADLVSGAAGGLRISRAPSQAGEMKFLSDRSRVRWGTAGISVETRRIVPGSMALLTEPNPFTGLLAIRFGSDRDNDQVTVFDVRGNVVSRLPVQNGMALWNGTDNSGRAMAQGSYLIAVEKAGRRVVRSVIMAR